MRFDNNDNNILYAFIGLYFSSILPNGTTATTKRAHFMAFFNFCTQLTMVSLVVVWFNLAHIFGTFLFGLFSVWHRSFELALPFHSNYNRFLVFAKPLAAITVTTLIKKHLTTLNLLYLCSVRVCVPSIFSFVGFCLFL